MWVKRLGLPTDSFPIDLCPDPKPPEPIPTKTCPQCYSEIAAFEKICPHCGYIFESQQKEASTVRRKFEEILSPEQRQQVRYLKNRATGAFNKNKPLDNLDELFKSRYNYYPPEDWYDGLIFGDDFSGWETNVQHYWRYLIATQNQYKGAAAAKEWIIKCVLREFKSKIEYARANFIKAFANTVVSKEEATKRADTRIYDLISYKPWWVILGFEKAPDQDYRRFIYVPIGQSFKASDRRPYSFISCRRTRQPRTQRKSVWYQGIHTAPLLNSLLTIT